MRDVGLADRIRARGVRVVEIAGWQTRGSATFAPRGSVSHHTAGPAKGVAPSLAICTYGRSDLPGPLCHVLLGRDLVAYVIAAGRANHAGAGGWRGLSGNSSVHGLEIEHTGTGPAAAQLRVAVQIHAAFLEAPGSSRDAELVCQHSEWAPRRKIDFRSLAPDYTPSTFRLAIRHALEDDMPLNDADKKWFAAEIRRGVAGAVLTDDRAGVGLRASVQQAMGEMFMRNRKIHTAVVQIAAEQAALAETVRQLGDDGQVIDYDRVEAAARRASEDALRDVLGGLDG